MQDQSTTNGFPRWTPDEDTFITDNFRKLTIKEMADHLGRTPSAVRNRRLVIGVSGAWKFEWTSEKLDHLRNAYLNRNGRHFGTQALADELGCTLISLSRKARELGLTDTHANVRDENGRYPSQIPMYDTDEERSRAMSERVKKLWRERGHPRGALGMKHTPEAKRATSIASRNRWKNISPEERGVSGRKAAMTRLKRYGSAGPANISNPYSRARGGKREDLDNQYFRSAWEANYARYLNWLRSNGEIQSWEYEPDTFVFHGETRGAIHYTPDFKVTEKNGAVIYHEIKGWMDGPSKTKLKRMKKHYPDIKVIVIGEDEYKSIAKWRGLIPEWE